MFASGLVVDGLHAFNNNLWTACDTVNGWGSKLDPEESNDLLKRDWVRRAKKFAENYFDNDLLEMTNCLKDVFNLHKWQNITRTIQQIDFAVELNQRVYTEVDTIGAQGCSGGACEVNF
jgi:ribonucleoside-diphosphate reductase alpha chain